MENIIIGLIIGGFTYGIMYYMNEKKLPEEKDKNISPLIPFIVGIIAAFASHYYFSTAMQTGGAVVAQVISENVMNNNVIESVMSNASDSYYSINRNSVKIPNTDVFIDIARF